MEKETLIYQIPLESAIIIIADQTRKINDDPQNKNAFY